MSTTFKGVYRNGQVQLLEKSERAGGAEVVVTFLDADQSSRGDASRQVRREMALKWLRESGWDLGGSPYPTRDELHDRTR
jgi:hypothetical protein